MAYVPAATSAGTQEGVTSPAPAQRATADAEQVALVCLRVRNFEFTIWASVEEALDACRELTPCDERHCIGHHTIVTKGGKVMETLPSAPVERRERKGETNLVMVRCPHCRRSHLHRDIDIGRVRRSPRHQGNYRVVS